MLFDLIQLDSFHWVRLQHATDQIFAVRRDLNWHTIVTLLDLHKQQSELFIIEWQTTANHGVQNDTARPNVNFLPTVGLAGDDFRCGVIWRPAGCAQSDTIFGGIGQAKIYQLDVMVFIKEEVLGLQVAMYHLVKVAVLYRRNDLLEDAPSFVFSELYMIKEG